MTLTATYDPNNEELQFFRTTVRKFLNEEVMPYYTQWEKDHMSPRSIWNKLGAAGLLGVDVPEKEGGTGADFPFSAIIPEEIARAGAAALATNVSIHSDIVIPYLLHLGTEEQKQQWLPKMLTGDVVGAIAMTEPNAGSDLAGIRTTAKAEGEHYRINGSKIFITNGQHAELVIVAAKTDQQKGSKGMSLFLVDTTLPGYSRGRKLDKMGQHAGDTSELFFDNLVVPKSAILGQAGEGFIHLMNELPRERLIIAIMGLGAADGALEWTIDYVQQRKAFGKSISDFQNTRFKLAEMKTAIELNRAFINQCIDQYIHGTLNTTMASMAKLAATELQGRVTDECVQLFGGYGYMSEYPISRAYVDARVQRIYGGSSEIMKEIIARSLVGR